MYNCRLCVSLDCLLLVTSNYERIAQIWCRLPVPKGAPTAHGTSMRGAALLVCAGALAATVRGPPALEGALMQPAEDGDAANQLPYCHDAMLAAGGLCLPALVVAVVVDLG